MAKTTGIDINMDDFTRIAEKTPVIADLKPSGKYTTMSKLVEIGGITPLLKRLLDAGLLHENALTVTGKTMAENLADVSDYPAGQDHCFTPRSAHQANRSFGGLLWECCTKGAVAKISGKEKRGLSFTSKARVYNSEEDALSAILDGTIVSGDVIVIRYEGPKGGPGMKCYHQRLPSWKRAWKRCGSNY